VREGQVTWSDGYTNLEFHGSSLTGIGLRTVDIINLVNQLDKLD
jgi:hypothetical protein